MKKIKKPLRNLFDQIMGNNTASIKGQLIYGIFWNFISAIAAQGFPMIAAIVAARLLGKVLYGQLGMINSTVIFFSTFAGLGLGITATKYIAQFHQEDPRKTGRIIGLINIFGLFSGIIMFIIFFITAPFLASTVLADPNLTLALRIASFLLIFNTIIGIQSGSIAGFGAFKDLARIGIIQGIFSACLTVISIYFLGFIGAVIALVISSIIGTILYKLTVNNIIRRFKINIEYLNSWNEKKILWDLSFPTMLSNIMVGPLIWIANIIIINTYDGYGQLGLFSAADQWKTALTFLPFVIGGVLLPMISSKENKNNHSLETVNVLASWVIVIIIALPLISFPEIIAIFYGQEYFSTIFLQTLSLMMLVSCILSYKDGIGRELVAKNLMWWGFLSNLLWGVLFIGSVVILKDMGSLGLAISYVISYGVNTVIFVPFYISKKVIPKNMILSKEVLLIWTILILQSIITIMMIPLWIRTVIFLISIIILLFSFYKIWKLNFDR